MERNGLLYYFLLALMLLAQLSGFGQSKKRDGYRQQLDKVYTAEAIAADVDYFYTSLQTAHPDLYRYVSPTEMDSMVADLKGKGSLSLQVFFNEINHIATTIGCGHLMVSYPKKLVPYFAKYAYYPPLHIEMHDSTAIVKLNLQDDESFDNAIVHSINGQSIDSIQVKMGTLLVRDGYNQAANNWFLQEGWFNELYIQYWPDSSQYTYQLEMLGDSGWITKTVTLPAYDYQTLKPKRPKREKPEPQLTIKLDDYTNTAILTIKSFDHLEIKRGRQSFGKFIKEAFWRIYQDQPEQLIIDLRSNEGGSSFFPEIIIGFLSEEPYRLYRNMEIRYSSKAYKKKAGPIKVNRTYRSMEKHGEAGGTNGNYKFDRFTGKIKSNPFHYAGTVYVMVNGGTYSAASELACYLNEHVEAVIVGGETGGTCDPITAGMHGIAKLPNTGITVHIPLVTYYKDITQPRQAGCGLQPDIPQYFRPTDSIPDPELERLLEIIEGQGLKVE